MSWAPTGTPGRAGGRAGPWGCQHRALGLRNPALAGVGRGRPRVVGGTLRGVPKLWRRTSRRHASPEPASMPLDGLSRARALRCAAPAAQVREVPILGLQGAGGGGQGGARLTGAAERRRRAPDRRGRAASARAAGGAHSERLRAAALEGSPALLGRHQLLENLRPHFFCWHLPFGLWGACPTAAPFLPPCAACPAAAAPFCERRAAPLDAAATGAQSSYVRRPRATLLPSLLVLFLLYLCKTAQAQEESFYNRQRASQTQASAPTLPKPQCVGQIKEAPRGWHHAAVSRHSMPGPLKSTQSSLLLFSTLTANIDEGRVPTPAVEREEGGRKYIYLYIPSVQSTATAPGISNCAVMERPHAGDASGDVWGRAASTKTTKHGMKMRAGGCESRGHAFFVGTRKVRRVSITCFAAFKGGGR